MLVDVNNAALGLGVVKVASMTWSMENPNIYWLMVDGVKTNPPSFSKKSGGIF